MPVPGSPSDAERHPIWFPHWKEALAHTELSPEERARFEHAIIGFLGFCKRSHAPATIMLAKAYLAQRPAQGCGVAREALRWFVRAGRTPPVQAPPPVAPDPPHPTRASQSLATAPVASAATRTPGRRSASAPPPLAAQDLGGADWERDLIKASRERGFLWRTEETYRRWATRFAAFLAPRSPYAAAPEDVSAFLSRMAVEYRASPSAQKQALNALVFFLQEGQHRELGELGFQRAAPKVRVPTVLTGEECQRLFAQLTGTTRLMAELAYGAGLRLLEVLRLRIHHLDLDRRQLQVRAAKGDRVEDSVQRGWSISEVAA